MSLAPLWPSFIRILAATAVMALVVWGGIYFVDQLSLRGKVHDLVVVVGLIPVACAVYGTLLWAFKIEGREQLESLLKKFRSRFKRA